LKVKATSSAVSAEAVVFAAKIQGDLPPEKWTPGYAAFASACCGVM
jgi:hypothetical protein